MSSMPIALALATTMCIGVAASVRVKATAVVPESAEPVTARENLERESPECGLDVMIADAYAAYREVDEIEEILSHQPMVAELRRTRHVAHARRDDVLERIRRCPRGAQVPEALTGHSPTWRSGAVLAAYLRLEEHEKASTP